MPQAFLPDSELMAAGGSALKVDREFTVLIKLNGARRERMRTRIGLTNWVAYRTT